MNTMFRRALVCWLNRFVARGVCALLTLFVLAGSAHAELKSETAGIEYEATLRQQLKQAEEIRQLQQLRAAVSENPEDKAVRFKVRTQMRAFAAGQDELLRCERDTPRQVELLPQRMFPEEINAAERAAFAAAYALQRDERAHLHALGPLTADERAQARAGWRKANQDRVHDARLLSDQAAARRPKPTVHSSGRSARKCVLREQLSRTSADEFPELIEQVRQLRQQAIEAERRPARNQPQPTTSNENRKQ